MSLLQTLSARMRRDGPLAIADYMAACNDAYYAQGDVFGRAGDFITAPEISQTFGELIGLWCAVTWQSLGAPKTFRLIECGPGRGTLMADALRAAARVPGFRDAARIHLVERSAALRKMQREKLKGEIVAWHEDLSEVPEGVCLVIANEFLDALPVRQWQKTSGGWIERAVDVNAQDDLHFAPGRARDLDIPLAVAADAPDGAIFETAPAAIAWTHTTADRIAAHGGAALVIDYGHTTTALGDTLQAVKAHRYHDPLIDPGTADLTAHVDFAAIATAAREMGARVFGPTPQGTWLGRLGIAVRAAQLATGKDEVTAKSIAAGVKRLTAPDAMGLLFKVLAFTHPTLEACEGFGEDGRA